jgi:Ser/Thr protein kinase RdoA (MazF antagonist)
MINNADSKEIIVKFASEKYDADFADVHKENRGYQNLIYEFKRKENSYILRLSSSSTRKFIQIKSELDFLHHLSNHGVSVSLPITSTDGVFIEEILLNEQKYYAVAFIKAKGNHITYPDFLNNHKLFYELGKITGRLHKGAKQFPKYLNNRMDWTDNYYLKNYKDFISSDEKLKRIAIKEHMDEITKINKEESNFGLIHGDLNLGNFFVDDDLITLFDFDECQNSWYIEDIAIQLFYITYVFNDDAIYERISKANEFMQHFLRGYKSEFQIDIEMLKQIPKFLLLREIIVHVGIYKKWDFKNLSGWSFDYFRDSSNRIINRIPIVEYNMEWHHE